LIFQASQLGLGAQWAETKKAYEQANDLLGDIVKVTPTSKVVGDLAQFMVSNNLSFDDVQKKAGELDFPGSVLEFFEGLMGQPYGGFPEPLRTNALRGRQKLDKRPGLTLEPLDLAKIKKDIHAKWGAVTECDVASYAMYPKVFEDYKNFIQKYGDLSVLPTRYFLSKPEIGEEFHVELEKGKVLILKLLAVGPLSDTTGQREVFYEMNGEVRQVTIDDNNAAVENTSRPKADPGDSSQVGAPMSGVVVEIRVKEGGEVKKGDPIAVLSAMKMVSSHEFSYISTTNRNRKWLSPHRTLVRSEASRLRKAIRSEAQISSVRLSNREISEFGSVRRVGSFWRLYEIDWTKEGRIDACQQCSAQMKFHYYQTHPQIVHTPSQMLFLLGDYIK
jgi:pyruvate carboxylase